MMGRPAPLATLAAVAGMTAVSAAAAGNNASMCCGPLSQSLSEIVFAPNSTQYKALNQRWSSTAVLQPGCVVAPTTAEHVSTAMKIISKKQCQFAVRSGGHNANPGANDINEGVSIDLSNLNNMTLASDRSYVSLGTGVTWGQAYDHFENDGIGFTGGICSGVGVGGLSVNGGQSLFLPKRGWVVDNIINYQLVLGSGDIVNANETSHSDLYKALKGGNTNFGIVTHIDLAAFPFDRMWAGEVTGALEGPPGAPLPVSRTEMQDLMSAAITNFTANNHNDIDSGIQLTTLYLSQQKGQLVNALLGNTADKERPASLQPFLAMPNQVANLTAQGHTKIGNFSRAISALQPDGFRQVTASLTYTNDEQTTREIWDAADAIYNSLDFKDQVDWLMSLIPQPKIQETYAAARGGNSLGLANVHEDQIVLWLTPRWTDPKYDDQMNKMRDHFIETVTEIAKKRNTYSPFLYANYAAPSQDVICGYGAESAAFLKATAAKYDPGRVFQKLMPGGFKLDHATCA